LEPGFIPTHQPSFLQQWIHVEKGQTAPAITLKTSTELVVPQQYILTHQTSPTIAGLTIHEGTYARVLVAPLPRQAAAARVKLLCASSSGTPSACTPMSATGSVIGTFSALACTENKREKSPLGDFSRQGSALVNNVECLPPPPPPRGPTTPCFLHLKVIIIRGRGEDMESRSRDPRFCLKIEANTVSNRVNQSRALAREISQRRFLSFIFSAS
jgi:hypothetical protein